jgi:hypothetical protein
VPTGPGSAKTVVGVVEAGRPAAVSANTSMLFARRSVTTSAEPPAAKRIWAAPIVLDALLSEAVEPFRGTSPAGSTVKPEMFGAAVALPALST